MIEGEGHTNYFSSNTIYDPASLNITNTIDLAGKLIPLFYLISSDLIRFKNEDQDIDSFYICVKVFFSGDLSDDGVELFSFKFDDSTMENETVIQKIKSRIKCEIEN